MDAYDAKKLFNRLKGLEVQWIKDTGDYERAEIIFTDGTVLKIRALRGTIEVSVGKYEFKEEFTV